VSDHTSSTGSSRLLAAGAALGALFLFFAMRQVDWPAVGEALRRVSLAWLLAAGLVTAAVQALFAARWLVLIGRAHGMSYADAFDFLAIGALAGLVLPPRLSDVARAVAAGRYRATSSTNLFGSIVVERLLDVLMLVLFGAAVLTLMDVPAPILGALATLLAIVLAAVVVLWIGEGGPIGVIARWVAGFRGPGTRVHAMAERFLAGTGVIRDRRLVPLAFLITLVAWTGAAAVAGLTMRAFGMATPWFAGAFVIVIINLAGILPAPPAGVGVYHYAAMVGVSPWIEDDSAAFAFALISHALSMAVVMAIGTVSLARTGLSLSSLRRMANRPDAQVPE
jgi:uncharacterized protein (TIRG00374 family)